MKLGFIIARFLCAACISTACLSTPNAWAAKLDEETFVFAGKCANGETYRLFSYYKPTQGALQSYYDYEGPAGKGTVQSDTSPKVMAVRVCHKLAEIINTRYWE